MKKMLCKRLSVILLLLITFFSVSLKSNAASFAYKDFDWDEFAEKNKSYWISACDGDKTGKCVDRILETKKRFYTRLYEILTIVQNNTGFIDDNIIIATVFYGLTDESFADPNSEKYNPYNLDDDDSSVSKNKYIGGDDGDINGAFEYFKKESDSLKTLVNNFIGYRTVCYGDNNETPQEYTKKDGTKYTACPNDTYEQIDNKCVVKIDEYKGSFFDSIGLSWIGTSASDRCKEEAKEKGYNSSFPKTNNTKEVNEEFFWDYLENSDYLDKKDHLQEYYTGVLGSLKKTHMKDLEEKEILDHKDEIIEVRKRIITGIKEVLKYYEDVTKKFNKTKVKKYWWPIGSDITSEKDSIMFASEAPSKTDISVKYGYITNTTDETRNELHKGIDIPGDLGITNVVASFDGVVAQMENSCSDTPDETCGDGYGNYIILQHNDGNYTIYAHLSQNSITVNNGDSVKKGQLIGKVGNSGDSKEPHLHFEVRVGGNDSAKTQDPLNFISASDPRSSGGGEIVIPEEYGNSGAFTYTKITDFKWAYNQKKVYELWKKTGAKTDNYIAMIDGRYLIACTSTFGTVGDKIDFYLADGTKLETIMFDEKSQKSVPWDRNPANKWGHNGGQQIIEFEITYNPNGSGNVGTWTGWAGQRVTSATNLGENVIK